MHRCNFAHSLDSIRRRCMGNLFQYQTMCHATCVRTWIAPFKWLFPRKGHANTQTQQEQIDNLASALDRFGWCLFCVRRKKKQLHSCAFGYGIRPERVKRAKIPLAIFVILRKYYKTTAQLRKRMQCQWRFACVRYENIFSQPLHPFSPPVSTFSSHVEPSCVP